MREYSGNALASASASLITQRMSTHAPSGHSARRILLVENEEGQRQLYE